MVLRRAIGNRQAIAISLDALGNVALARNDFERAGTLYAEGLALREALGDMQGRAHTLHNMAKVRRSQGAHQEALALHATSLRLYQRLGNRLGIAWGLEGIAGLASTSGKVAASARLFGAAAESRKAINAPLLPSERATYDRDVAIIRVTLGEATFTVAWDDGAAMPLDQAIDAALDITLVAGNR